MKSHYYVVCTVLLSLSAVAQNTGRLMHWQQYQDIKNTIALCVEEKRQKIDSKLIIESGKGRFNIVRALVGYGA